MVVEEFIEASEASIGRRLRWYADRKPGGNPAQFAWRAYAAEAAAGGLHRSIIHGEDEALYWKLVVWLRSHPMPKGIDIPTKPEWYTRQIEAGKAKQGPTRRLRTEGQLIYETLMARRHRTRCRLTQTQRRRKGPENAAFSVALSRLSHTTRGTRSDWLGDADSNLRGGINPRWS